MNLELEFEKLRDERDNKQELTGTIIGQCQSFCPEYESMDRQLRKDINKFEVILIKKYQRSAAGKTKAFAEDIRPINVLWDVTKYLFTLLNPRKAYHIYEQSVFRDNFSDMYNNLEFLYELYRFIEDRLRAVRLDISAQSLVCDHSIVVLERIVRFYAVFNHLLYHHSDFDLYLNFDQLSRTLADLMDIYSKRNISSPEFVHYFTLTNIKDPALFDDMNIFRKSVSHDMLYAYHQNNYHLVFDIFGKFDYLSKCIFLPHLLSVSEKCIRTMKNTINDTVSIDFITSLIPINPEELVLIIEKCGIVMNNGMMDLKDKTGDSKDYQVARSQNPYLEQVRIMNVEMLILNGQVDLVMRNDIIRKYASNLIGRLGVDKTNEMEKEEIVKIDTTNIEEEKRKEKPKKKAKIAKQKPEDVKLDKSKAQADLHTSKMITNRIVHQFTHQLILKHLNTSILHSHVRGHITKWKQLLDGCIKVLVIDNEKSSTIVKLLENENLSVQLTNMSDYKTVDFSDYNFMIFIVENKKVQKTLKEKNKMYNLYVGNRKELETKIEDENFVRSIRESKQIMQQNLSDLVRDKSKDEVMDILLKLRKNKRNDSRIERNINLHKSHRQLVNFVVYYEKGTI